MKRTLNYSDTNDERTRNVNALEMIKYVILIVLSVLISLINLKFNNEIMIIPVVIGFLIAAVSNDIPIIGIIIPQSIVLLIRMGFGGFGIYIFQLLMFILSIIVLKPVEMKFDSEKYKFGKRVIFITIITSCLIYLRKYSFYTVCELTIFNLCIEYICYKIFSNGINVMKNLGKNKAYSEIEIISAGILLFMALISLMNLNNKNISIISGTLILCVLWIITSRIKLAYGIISAVAFCMVHLIIMNESIYYLPYLLLIGLFSNLFNRIDKRILFILNCIALVIVIYIGKKYEINLMLLTELIISMFVLCFIKLIKSVKYIDNSKLLPEPIMEIEERQTEEVELRKQRLSEFKIKIKNAMSYNKTNILFDEFYKDRNNILEKIFDILNDKKSISENEIVQILNNAGVYFAQDDLGFDEEIQNMQLRGVTRLINNIFIVDNGGD